MIKDFSILVAMVLINRTLQYTVILPGKIDLNKSNSITTLQTIHTNYIISFKVNYDFNTTLPIYNLIDFISKDGKRAFILRITSNPESNISLTKDGLNFWIGIYSTDDQLIKVSHLYVGNFLYNCSLSINGKTVYSVIDNASRTFEDVKVYAYNQMRRSITGFVRSINITSKGKDLGFLVRDVYLNIRYSQSSFSELEKDSKYPQYPDGYHFIDEFHAPRNFDRNYSQRIRGWFQVARDGNYTFYISCDDFCDLYLSGGIDPGNKTKIISQNKWIVYLTWSRSDQKSGEIFLKANNKYYIEALMCQGPGVDSLSVAFKQANESLSSLKPISAKWFSQMRIDEYPYDSLNIMENEICISENGAYRICTCKNGYAYENKGSSCVDVDECLVSCKYPNSTCINLNGTFNCICPLGYFFNWTILDCQDYDECFENCRYTNSTCLNLIGTFQCICPQGYLFNYSVLECQDIDECSVSCMYKNSTCKNLNGTFECNCPQGYHFNHSVGECLDFDECLVSCKYQNSTCKNLNGTFECNCPPGYHFNHTTWECQDFDECSVSCKYTISTCTNLNGTFECHCPYGYFFNHTVLECQDKSNILWSSWSECTVTCGIGRKVRFPIDHSLFTNHDENEFQTEACNLFKCPDDGEWNNWEDFTSCSQTCGNGVKYRYRNCSTPSHNGLNCYGINEDFQKDCEMTTTCPVNGIWSDWSHWSLCSQPCGDGNQSRFQSCNSLKSQLSGFICKGIRKETRICLSRECKNVALNVFVSLIDEEYIEQYSDISKEPSKLLRDKISGEIKKLYKNHGKNTSFQLSLHSIRKDESAKTGS